MKAQLEQSDIDAIAQEVVKAIRPLLSKGKTENNTLFTVDSLAEYLGCKERWIRDRVYFKEIPFVKLGGLLKFKKCSIDKWIANQETPVMNSLSKPLKLAKP